MKKKHEGITSATRQARQQWFSVCIFPLGLLFGLTGNRPQSAPACSFLRYSQLYLRNNKMKHMRKLLFILLIGISVSAFGQVQSIGFQSGVNLTNLTGDIFKDSKYRTGIIGGFNYELLFKSNYTIGTDILYAQQGFIDNITIMDNYGNIIGDSKHCYDYLSIPIKFGYTKGQKLKSFVKIGICPSFLLSAKSTVSKFDSSGDVAGYEKVDIKNYVSKFDFGGLLELGVGYSLENRIELFSSLTGRKSLTSFSNSDYFQNSKIRHYGFSLMVGLKYRLNDK